VAGGFGAPLLARALAGPRRTLADFRPDRSKEAAMAKIIAANPTETLQDRGVDAIAVVPGAWRTLLLAPCTIVRALLGTAGPPD
jgi:hypothetical protein